MLSMISQQFFATYHLSPPLLGSTRCEDIMVFDQINGIIPLLYYGYLAKHLPLELFGRNSRYKKPMTKRSSESLWSPSV
jgi:hypothetical protein